MPVMRPARVLHAEDVVNLQMRRRALLEARLVDAVLHVVRHGLRRTSKIAGSFMSFQKPATPSLHERADRACPTSRACSPA